MINRFREQVYQSFEQRGDAGLELIDALTSTPGVESPVELSESPLFRRRFSSVYDVLKWGCLHYDRLRQLLDELQPEDAETIAGYEVYAMDCTEDPAPEAETLPDRIRTKKGKNAGGSSLFLASAVGKLAHILMYASRHRARCNIQHG